MRTPLTTCLTACLICLMVASSADSQDPGVRKSILEVPFEDGGYQATDDELKEIESLIDGLKDVRDPDFGFVSTFAGTGFGPVAETANISVGRIFIDHGLKSHPNTMRLVEYGPKAINALLARLDDTTETQLSYQVGASCDGMAYDNYVYTDATNPFEKAIAATQTPNAEDHLNHREPAVAHTLTIGDVCFAILGQIVNRPYLAVRYEPSKCLIVCSPTHHLPIVETLRSIWKNDAPAKRLFQSLCFDYARYAKRDDADAAVRLLYYFPRESVPFFVEKLDAISKTSVPLQSADRDVFDFIRTLSNLDNAEISDAIARVIERLDSGALAQKCANVTFLSRHAGLVLLRLKRELFEGFDPATEVGYTEETWLNIAVQHYPDAAEDIFKRFLQLNRKGADLVVFSVLTSLEDIPWAVELLRPYLKDDRLTGDDYGPEYDLRQSRVCDLAARAIAYHAPGTTFYLEGDCDYLDRQIANIIARLDGKPTTPLAEEFAVDLNGLPLIAPDKVLEVATNCSSVYKDSTNEVFSAYECQINVATGEVTKSNRFDALKQFHFVGSALSERGIYFDGENKVLREFDFRSFKWLRSVPCPFTDGWKSEGPLSIWCLGDAAVLGDNEAVIAATRDGAIHVFNLATQQLETVWKDEYGHQASLECISGTQRCLVSEVGETPMFWDQETKRMMPLEKLPNSNWREAFGEYGRREENHEGELWNLEKHEKVRFQLPRDVYIYHLQCNFRKMWCFAQLNDGHCYLFDLKTRTAIGLLDLPHPSSWTNFTITNDDRSLICTQNLTQWDLISREVKVPKTVFAIYSMDKIERSSLPANAP